MPDWSRRRALHAIGSVATVAVAGCSGGDSGFEDVPADDRGDRVTDYELQTVRDGEGRPLFWRSDEDSAADERTRGHEYVASRDDAEELSFGDSEAAAELASFLRETDFESSSVLLETAAVAECNELVFRGVWRSSDSLDTEYCSRLRPADAACSVEARDTAGVALRLPFTGEDISSFGSSWGSRCDPQPVRPSEEGDGGGGGA